MPANVQQVRNTASVKLVSLPCIVNNGPFFAVNVPAVAIALIWQDEYEIPVRISNIFSYQKATNRMDVTNLSMVQIQMVKW